MCVSVSCERVFVWVCACVAIQIPFPMFHRLCHVFLYTIRFWNGKESAKGKVPARDRSDNGKHCETIAHIFTNNNKITIKKWINRLYCIRKWNAIHIPRVDTMILASSDTNQLFNFDPRVDISFVWIFAQKSKAKFHSIAQHSEVTSNVEENSNTCKVRAKCNFPI